MAHRGLQLDRLKPGNYVLEVTVTDDQGRRSVERSGHVRVGEISGVVDHGARARAYESGRSHRRLRGRSESHRSACDSSDRTGPRCGPRTSGAWSCRRRRRRRRASRAPARAALRFPTEQPRADEQAAIDRIRRVVGRVRGEEGGQREHALPVPRIQRDGADASTAHGREEISTVDWRELGPGYDVLERSSSSNVPVPSKTT